MSQWQCLSGGDTPERRVSRGCVTVAGHNKADLQVEIGFMAILCRKHHAWRCFQVASA
jgi:hypothetical protein